jgi:hypothetical protein
MRMYSRGREGQGLKVDMVSAWARATEQGLAADEAGVHRIGAGNVGAGGVGAGGVRLAAELNLQLSQFVS